MLRVLLYGRSLYISGLQASLKAVPDLDIQEVEAQSDCLQERMASWKPDVLIFELNDMVQVPSLIIVKKFRKLLLIGMDIECDELLVLSGYQQHVFSSTDLVGIIQQENQVPDCKITECTKD